MITTNVLFYGDNLSILRLIRHSALIWMGQPGNAARRALRHRGMLPPSGDGGLYPPRRRATLLRHDGRKCAMLIERLGGRNDWPIVAESS